MIQFDEHIVQMGWFNHQLLIYNIIYIYIPGTQMTLVLNGKGRILEGWNTKIEDKQVPGIHVIRIDSAMFPL